MSHSPASNPGLPSPLRHAAAVGSLALVWVAGSNAWTWPNAILGVALAIGILALVSPVRDRVNHPARPMPNPGMLLLLAMVFAKELLVANVQMAIMVLSPIRSLHPGIVAVPLEPLTDTQRTVLTSLITLTPGTLSLELSDDRRTLFVHTMDARNPAGLITSIKSGFEALVRRALP